MSKINETWMIKITPFWMDLVFTIYYLAAPLVLIELKATPVELGLLGTLTSSVHMVMAHLMGRLSDHLGRRRLIIAAPFLFATTCILMTYTTQVWTILGLSLINGLCLSLFWPSLQAWVADLHTGDLAHNIGDLNLSWTAAYAAGPVLSGLLYSVSSRLPFFVAAAMALALFAFVCSSVRDTQTHRPSAMEQPGGEAPSWQMRFLYAAWIANFVSWFLLGNARYQFPKLARELGTPPQTIGLLLACIGVAQFAGFLILQRHHRWHFKARYLLAAQGMAALAMGLITCLNQRILLGLAFLLLGGSVSVTYYSSLYYAVHLLKKKGRGTGLHESILGTGAVLGPILGGIAAHEAGLRAPYLLCLVILSAGTVAQFALLKNHMHTAGTAR